MRETTLSRKTKETDVRLRLNVDGTRQTGVDTGVGFFDHMLTALAFHAGWDMELTCRGDLHVDAHHTVEDCGIVLGQALGRLTADKSGLTRYGHAFVPMDEALGFCALDVSGRPYLVFDCEMKAERVGAFDTELAVEFFRAFAFNAGLTLHLRCEYGANAHHQLEALFKSCGQALAAALTLRPDGGTLSTKGVLA